jgi:hypothetical protein
MRWADNVARIGENFNAYRIVVGKRDKKKPLETPTLRREANTEMYLEEAGWEGVDWIHTAQDKDK